MDIVEDLRTTVRSSNPAFFQKAADEIERLRRDCAEAYQVVGTISGVLLDNESVRMEDVSKALDNLIAAANGEPRPHDNLLPFTVTPNAALTERGD